MFDSLHCEVCALTTNPSLSARFFSLAPSPPPRLCVANGTDGKSPETATGRVVSRFNGSTVTAADV